MRNDQQKQAVGFIIGQLIVTFLGAVIALVVGWIEAYSALTGGLIATLTTAWFAAKVFTNRSDEPARIIRSLYLGEIYKILLTAALFLLAFVLIRPISAVALLGCYFIVYMTPAMLSVFGGVPFNKRE